MIEEFGIIDQDGTLFGLPARTFTSREAADSVLEHIHERRKEMEREAREASDMLSGPFQHKLEEQHKRILEDRVQRWDNESARSYSIVSRRVSAWEAVA